jgi:hypothetical protein
MRGDAKGKNWGVFPAFIEVSGGAQNSLQALIPATKRWWAKSLMHQPPRMKLSVATAFGIPESVEIMLPSKSASAKARLRRIRVWLVPLAWASVGKS